MNESKSFFSRSEVGRRFGISLDTVDRLAARGELRAVKVGTRVLFHVIDLNEFVAKRLNKPAADAQSLSVAPEPPSEARS